MLRNVFSYWYEKEMIQLLLRVVIKTRSFDRDGILLMIFPLPCP